MNPVHHEAVFESAIASSLVRSGWRQGVPESYDRDLGLNPAEIVEFVKATQPKEWARLLQLQSDDEAGAARRLAADRRKDWAEKTSTRLARRYDLIAVEKLNIGAMTKSARGTAQNPGKNVRQKAGLNRGILTNCWGLLVRRLKHKAPGRVIEVNPVFTSQTCHRCGHRDSESRESQSRFACRSCAYQANADVNAARNVRTIAAGHALGVFPPGGAVTARGALQAMAGAKNREPQPVLLSA